jgi:hypothetical protein
VRQSSEQQRPQIQSILGEEGPDNIHQRPPRRKSPPPLWLTNPELAQAKKEQHDATLLEFEERVKATNDREELKSVVAQLAGERPHRRLYPPELVLVCNQMAKLCDPQRMPWKAWKDMQVCRIL